ncbi:MAG: hypothetical protein VXW42_08520, partial [Planctomycetota bacterium]|nr:hypothetical protein [Planctomycetota bacterium]
MSGILFAGSLIFSPRHGYWSQRARTRQLADQIAIEDVVVLLYKSQETAATFPWSTIDPRILALANKRGLLQSPAAGHYFLSDAGRTVALEVQGRRARWLTYLVTEVGLAPDHAPETAEHLEHLGDDLLQKSIDSTSDPAQTQG